MTNIVQKEKDLCRGYKRSKDTETKVSLENYRNNKILYNWIIASYFNSSQKWDQRGGTKKNLIEPRALENGVLHRMQWKLKEVCNITWIRFYKDQARRPSGGEWIVWAANGSRKATSNSLIEGDGEFYVPRTTEIKLKLDLTFVFITT